MALRDALEVDTGERFDCALANLYVRGGAAACAWHRDPEHGDAFDGAKWARATYVVSIGEPRRFAFRPYRSGGDAAAGGNVGGVDAAAVRAWLAEGGRHVVTPLFTGDVMMMHGACNEDYEHSVLPGQGAANEEARISLVFKRAHVGRDGRRGHSLEGQGRRSRARARAQTEEGAGRMRSSAGARLGHEERQARSPARGSAGGRGRQGRAQRRAATGGRTASGRGHTSARGAAGKGVG